MKLSHLLNCPPPLTAYLGLWPVPVQPVSWKAPPARGYSGPHIINERLANLQIIPLGLEEGPEHVVLARDGKLYAALASGNILRLIRTVPPRRYSPIPAAGCSASTSMQKVI